MKDEAVLSYSACRAGLRKILQEGGTVENIIKTYWRIIGEDTKEDAKRYKLITKEYAKKALKELKKEGILK